MGRIRAVCWANEDGRLGGKRWAGWRESLPARTPAARWRFWPPCYLLAYPFNGRVCIAPVAPTPEWLLCCDVMLKRHANLCRSPLPMTCRLRSASWKRQRRRRGQPAPRVRAQTGSLLACRRLRLPASCVAILRCWPLRPCSMVVPFVRRPSGGRLPTGAPPHAAALLERAGLRFLACCVQTPWRMLGCRTARPTPASQSAACTTTDHLRVQTNPSQPECRVHGD